MICLLAIVLFVQIFLSLKFVKGDILSPLALSYESFFISAFVAAIGMILWGNDINVQTFFTVLVSLMFFSVGFLLVPFPKRRNRRADNKGYIIIDRKISLFFLLWNIIILCLTFIKTLQIAKGVNETADLSNMLHYARNAYLFSDASLGIILSLAGFSVVAIGYFYTYIVINNMIYKKRGKRIVGLDILLNCSIIFVSLLLNTLSSSRTFLIKWLVVVIVFYFYTMKFKNKISSFNILKIIKIALCLVGVLVLFFLMFQLLGMATGKTGTLTIMRMLYLYSGAALPALAESLKIYKYDGRIFGEESLYGFYSLLNHFGLNIPNDTAHLPFVTLADGSTTNIYTSLRTYLYDFGYIGMFIVQLILGIIMGILYRKLIMKYEDNPVYLCFYGILMYGVVMQGLAEILLKEFMALTNISIIVVFTVLYNFFIKRKIKV